MASLSLLVLCNTFLVRRRRVIVVTRIRSAAYIDIVGNDTLLSIGTLILQLEMRTRPCPTHPERTLPTTNKTITHSHHKHSMGGDCNATQ